MFNIHSCTYLDLILLSLNNINLLSVATSIVELIVAACQMSNFLKNYIKSAKDALNSTQAVFTEVIDINVCLNQLQKYVLKKQKIFRS